MKHLHDEGIVKLNTIDYIKEFLKKRKIVKSSVNKNDMPLLDTSANHIAVILDGEVQEVLRAENRLTALFLSNPQFVEFDPNKVYPRAGWKYSDGLFVEPERNNNEESI